MKKKVIIISAVIILLILLFPIRKQLKDGGTVEYKSLTYKVSKIQKHSETEHQDGIVVEIFGKEIFNNVTIKHIERDLDDVIVTEVDLGKRAWINSLTKIKIKGTNDYFEITEKVKWEVPKHEEGTTISFAIPIPYTFVVDGVKYNGVYELNDASWSKKDEGLDYNLRVVNLTKDGKIEIEVESADNFNLVFNQKPGNVKKQIIDKNTNKQYDYNIYVWNGDVQIIIDNKTYSLEEALNENKITMDEIITKANKDIPNAPSYDDGGSIEYHYDNYTIIKFHTIDGNRDVYIGNEKLTIHDVK